MDKNDQLKLASDVRKTLGDETVVTIYAGRKFSKDIPEFVMLFQAAGKNLFKLLTPGACKVLGYMFSIMQYSNHIGCDQKTFSEELGLSVRTVNGALNELKKLNVILGYKDPQDGRRVVYVINGHAAWKGKIAKRKSHLKEHDKNQLKMFNEQEQPD